MSPRTDDVINTIIMQSWANYMTGAFLHLSCDRRHFAFVFFSDFGPALSLSLIVVVDRGGWVLQLSELVVIFGVVL